MDCLYSDNQTLGIEQAVEIEIDIYIHWNREAHARNRSHMVDKM